MDAIATEVLEEVSILARPEGRALPCAAATSPCPRSGFNPRPARRPGAPLVSLARHQPRHDVSILARPEGRALPVPNAAGVSDRSRFQSSPGPKAGRSATARSSSTSLPSPFQSSPGPKAGRSLPAAARLVPPATEVSILARPEGRALLSPICVAFLPVIVFQSSPGPKAGRSSTFPTKMGRAPSILAGSRRFAGPYAPAEPGAPGAHHLAQWVPAAALGHARRHH